MIDEMQRRLNELQKEEVLSPSLKELAIKIGVTSVFRYSAGVGSIWRTSPVDTARGAGPPAAQRNIELQDLAATMEGH